METSPMLCRANQWFGFYMIGTSVKKEVKLGALQLFPRKFSDVFRGLRRPVA